MKTAVVCALLVVIAGVAVDALNDQSMVVGYILPEHRLLDRQTVTRDGKTQFSQTTDYHYPSTQKAGGLVTGYKIIDVLQNGKNAQLVKVDGGVSTRFLNLSFESKEGTGLHYIIETWGL